MSQPVLIMAGGTGGHVFPGLALARLLRERSLEVVWLGTERGLESRVIPAEGIPIERLSVGGLRGKGMLTWLAAPFRLALALLQALAVMRRHRQPREDVAAGAASHDEDGPAHAPPRTVAEPRRSRMASWYTRSSSPTQASATTRLERP